MSRSCRRSDILKISDTVFKWNKTESSLCLQSAVEASSNCGGRFCSRSVCTCSRTIRLWHARGHKSIRDGRYSVHLKRLTHAHTRHVPATACAPHGSSRAWRWAPPPLSTQISQASFGLTPSAGDSSARLCSAEVPLWPRLQRTCFWSRMVRQS